MPEESERELLKKILAVLTRIRAITALGSEEKLALAKKRLLPESSMKLQIYDLCDGTKTIQEIASTIQKPEPSDRAAIGNMRNVGLIRTYERDGKQVHEQAF